MQGVLPQKPNDHGMLTTGTTHFVPLDPVYVATQKSSDSQVTLITPLYKKAAPSLSFSSFFSNLETLPLSPLEFKIYYQKNFCFLNLFNQNLRFP